MLDKFKSIFNSGKSTSPQFKLDLTDLKKVCRTGLFVGASATLVYIIGNLHLVDFDGKDQDTGVNLIIVSVLTFVLDAVNRYVKNNTDDKQEEK